MGPRPHFRHGHRGRHLHHAAPLRSARHGTLGACRQLLHRSLHGALRRLLHPARELVPEGGGRRLLRSAALPLPRARGVHASGPAERLPAGLGAALPALRPDPRVPRVRRRGRGGPSAPGRDRPPAPRAAPLRRGVTWPELDGRPARRLPGYLLPRGHGGRDLPGQPARPRRRGLPHGLPGHLRLRHRDPGGGLGLPHQQGPRHQHLRQDDLPRELRLHPRLGAELARRQLLRHHQQARLHGGARALSQGGLA
mmetsp:Transcript_87499/g.271836  ORF Transcript_87499/g.271836 Transcript_87499/m.271836 type:complete len:253 (+) Transcript_87499:300-1058(+)